MRDNQRYASSYAGTWAGAGMSQRVFDTRVMPLFGAGLLMTAAAAFLGWGLPFPILIAAMIGEVILVMTAGKWQRAENRSLNMGLYFLLTALSGLTLVPLLHWANMKNPMLIVQALGVTGLTFAGLMVYATVTRRDFSGMGGFLVTAIIGVIVASIFNIFFHSTMFSLVISMVSVGIFSAFVLYDMAIIRQTLSDQDYMFAAIMLYIDFIGLFQNILRILGIMGSSDD